MSYSSGTGPTNARLIEIWIRTGTDGSGSGVLRKINQIVRPGVMLRTMSTRLNHRLEIDETEKPMQMEIDAGPLHAAMSARQTNRPLKVGDRVTLLTRRTRTGPADAAAEHYEVVSIDGADDGRTGGIARVTVGLKAAAAPEGSLAAKAGGSNL